MKRVTSPLTSSARPRAVVDGAPVSGEVEQGRPIADTSDVPIASGAASFFPTSALPGVPHKGAFALKLDEATRRVLTPGLRALADRLDEIEALVRAGQPVRCVFDLDNTVFDTRWRTLFCARKFDERMGTHFFAKLEIDGVHEDGGATATALGLPDNVVEEFEKFWQREFWLPENLVHDRPIAAVIELIHACQERGAEIVYLTGRAESYVDDASGETKEFRPHTHGQLKAAGVDVNDDALHLKPAVGERTAPYKARLLEAWRAQVVLGMFVTEGRRDVEHVHENVPGAHCFLLDCKFERDGPACDGVPVLPRIF